MGTLSSFSLYCILYLVRDRVNGSKRKEKKKQLIKGGIWKEMGKKKIQNKQQRA